MYIFIQIYGDHIGPMILTLSMRMGITIALLQHVGTPLLVDRRNRRKHPPRVKSKNMFAIDRRTGA